MNKKLLDSFFDFKCPEICCLGNLKLLDELPDAINIPKCIKCGDGYTPSYVKWLLRPDNEGKSNKEFLNKLKEYYEQTHPKLKEYFNEQKTAE
jgi:hypothetical protein